MKGQRTEAGMMGSSRVEAPLPEISRFFGIVIRMFWRDHAPPRFHAEYGSSECAINLLTLEVISGSFPRRALALTLEWAAEHREALMEDWNLCVTKQTPRKIPPLE
jgi:hypothetical protein